MSTPSNHFKLGLFVLLCLAALFVTAGALGARSARQETVTYRTYFNESVQGLDLGSPVKFRGVTIGLVSAIEIAPDQRHVEVVAELDVEDIRRMGLTEDGVEGNTERDGPVQFIVPPDLRAQLGSQGITGVKFILIDFFDPSSNPLPDLAFPPADNYIPAAASLMKNLEDSVVKAVDRLPEVADSILAITTQIDAMLKELKQKQVIDSAASTLANVDAAVTDLRRVLAQVDQAGVPERAARTIDNLNDAVTKMSRILDRVDGDGGLVASAHRATSAFGDLGQSAHGTSQELQNTLVDLGEAAQAIRDLAETLERDPDMLLKGRAIAEEP
jgi:phospholipid/cholesterol/gamma-HCH transport system substrate-binding protein